MHPLARLFSLILFFCVTVVFCPATEKTTLLVSLDDEPGWRDMAFLAAVPASEPPAARPSTPADDPLLKFAVSNSKLKS
jgi:hypothetical protein